MNLEAFTNVGVSYFNNDSENQFRKNKLLANDKKVHSLVAGNVVVLYNYESKTLFGLTLLKNFETGTIYRKNTPLDIQAYTGKIAKYNMYDIAGKSYFFPEPIRLESFQSDIEATKTKSHMWATPRGCYKRITFKDAPQVTLKFQQWVSNQLFKLMIQDAMTH
jgi:hypothetical protein